MNNTKASTNNIRRLDEELSTLSHEYTIKILESHGNQVSPAQNKELHIITRTAAGMIAGEERKELIRKASPLPCGAGKTTAVRGLIKATHELNRRYRIIVCAEKVEALCELKRDLTGEDGVPREKISLIHSYAHDPDFDLESPKDNAASEAADDWGGEHAQFVLLTHSKLRHSSDKLKYDLLIYDETLLLGEASTIALADLAGEIGKCPSSYKLEQSAA